MIVWYVYILYQTFVVDLYFCIQAIAFNWSTHLSEEFLRLMAAHDPVTALIVAHFAVLLAECRLCE